MRAFEIVIDWMSIAFSQSFCCAWSMKNAIDLWKLKCFVSIVLTYRMRDDCKRHQQLKQFISLSNQNEWTIVWGREREEENNKKKNNRQPKTHFSDVFFFYSKRPCIFEIDSLLLKVSECLNNNNNLCVCLIFIFIQSIIQSVPFVDRIFFVDVNLVARKPVDVFIFFRFRWTHLNARMKIKNKKTE